MTRIQSPTPPSQGETPEVEASLPQSPSPSSARTSSASADHTVERFGSRAASAAGSFEQTYGNIRDSLSFSTSNLLVDKGDLQRVHTNLETLSPPGYRAAVERMDSEGLLPTYVDKLDYDSREAFLAQAERKNLIRRQAGEKVEGRFDPPSIPSQYVNDARLPAGMRQAIHASNTSAHWAYANEYSQYGERYRAAVEKTQSDSELRDLGGPLKAKQFSEPGFVRGHPEYNAGSIFNETSLVTQHGKIRGSVEEHRKHLRGEQTGHFWLEGEGTAKRLGEQFQASGTIGTGNRLEGKLERGVSVEAKEIPYGVKFNEAGEATERRFGPDFANVTFKKDGEVEFALEVPEFSVPVPGEENPVKFELGVYSKFNTEEGTVGAGLKGEIGGNPLGAEGKVGVGAKFVARREARATIANTEDFFQTPPELAQRTGWNSMTEQRRESLNHLGWTEAEWTSRLSR